MQLNEAMRRAESEGTQYHNQTRVSIRKGIQLTTAGISISFILVLIAVHSDREQKEIEAAKTVPPSVARVVVETQRLDDIYNRQMWYPIKVPVTEAVREENGKVTLRDFSSLIRLPSGFDWCAHWQVPDRYERALLVRLDEDKGRLLPGAETLSISFNRAELAIVPQPDTALAKEVGTSIDAQYSVYRCSQK
jgi:hypothetical protein